MSYSIEEYRKEIGLSSPQKRRNGKYNAVARTIDGIRFQSKLEANRYLELKLLQKAGEIIRFHRQVPFDLPGGIRYICDFLIIWKDGKITYEDVKGFETRAFKDKKKMVEALYPGVVIILVTKPKKRSIYE